MDTVFFHEENVSKNFPVLLALIDSFHNYTQGFIIKAVIPYSEGLTRFPAHIQQVEMESIGKKYSQVEKQLLPEEEFVAQFVFGEPGTNSQHSFFQSLHQGRVSPIEFIGYCKSQGGEIKLENNDCFNAFMSNMFAQADAFALGESNKELFSHFEGDRPSFILLFKDELNAFNLGQLTALYEHRCAASGFLAGINTWDQYGVNLGKKLALSIEPYLGKDKAKI